MDPPASLAYHLQGDSLVLEAEDRVGGLGRSIERDGGVFDIGGHSLHTPCPEVGALVRKLLDNQWFVQPSDEFDTALALTGRPSVAEIDRSVLF